MKFYHRYYKLFKYLENMNQYDFSMNGSSLGVDNMRGDTRSRARNIREMSSADCDLAQKDYVKIPHLFKGVK